MELTDLRLELRDRARKLADGILDEVAAEWDRSCAMDRDLAVRELNGAGLLGLTISREDGGKGLGFQEFIVSFEQLGRTNYPAAYIQSSTCSGPVLYIRELGSDGVRRKYLPSIASGKYITGIALTEPQAGSDIGAISTRAERQGNQVRLNGQKIYVGGGGEAEVYVVFARMSDDPGTKGIGCLVVDETAPGLSFGTPFPMMGSRPLPRRELIFDDCLVPAENVLAGPGEFNRLIEIFNGERIHNAGLALGMAQGAYEHALAHVRSRQQFGRRLADFQGIQWKLADMATTLEACRGLIYRAAVALDHREPLGVVSSQAKLFAATHCPRVVDEALQLEGALGYSEGSRVERAYRDIRLVPIAGGSVEMMRNYLGGKLAKGDES